MGGRKQPNPRPKGIKRPKPPPAPPRRRTMPLDGYKPACLDSSDANLDNRWYCRFCYRAWYNCLCSHDD